MDFTLSQSLEDLFKLVLDQHASKVQVFNKVNISEADGKWKHSFTVTVDVQLNGTIENFKFLTGEVIADHELNEQKKEDTPEYENFQRTMVSMFHRVNTIERRLALIKQTKLPNLVIEVQA
jgi:hypothetical protein